MVQVCAAKRLWVRDVAERGLDELLHVIHRHLGCYICGLESTKRRREESITSGDAATSNAIVKAVEVQYLLKLAVRVQ